MLQLYGTSNKCLSVIVHLGGVCQKSGKSFLQQGQFLIGYPEGIPGEGVQYIYWMDGYEGGILEMGKWMDEDLQTRRKSQSEYRLGAICPYGHKSRSQM